MSIKTKMQSLIAAANAETGKGDTDLTTAVQSLISESGGTSDHRQLTNRDAENQHPITAITGLQTALDGKQPSGDYATRGELDALADIVDGKADAADIPSLEGYATEAYVQNYHDNTKQDIITDLATIRSGASKGATAVQPEAGKGLFSGSYNDLTDKPTIPAVTEESVTNALGYVPADVNDVFAYTENPAFTNLFDTVEIEYGKLINITDKTIEDTTANLATTGFIPVNANSIIRVNDDFLIAKSGTPAFMLYDANKNAVQALRTSSIVAGAYYVELVASDANGYITAFKIKKPSSTAYIRIANDSRLIGENPVLTVDEEITYEMGYGEKLNSKVKVDFSQIINSPQKNCWSILPYERLNIAYSSIGRKPINTVEHFTDAATNFGYNALKCDVRPTSDGELVCCHDAGFTFNASGKITTYDSSNQTKIHDVTAATCLGYSFPTGEHPCLVGDYLDVCRKYGKVAFITIRNEYMDVVIPKLLEELKAHNMTYATIISCMTYNSLVTWRTYDKSVMINYTLNAGVAIDQSEIDRAIGLGYCSLCGFGLTSSATTPNHDCDFEYARANGIRLLQAIAYKEGSPEACYAMGYDGCQIAYAWNPVAVSVDAYTKAETENLIATAIGGAIGGSY